MMSDWDKEVFAGYLDVWAELSPTEQDICRDVPVVAMTGDGSAWGRYFPQTRRIEMYREVFDAMPDPENRQRQVRDVIRHELHHALGEWHPEQGHIPLGERGSAWLGGLEMTVVRNGLSITLPELLR